MHSRLGRLSTVALLAVGLVVACGEEEGDEPRVETQETTATTNEPEPETTTTTEVDDAQAAAKDYFDAFATYDPSQMQRMLELSAPGSLAHNYARFQIALTMASEQEGQLLEPEQVQVENGAITLCPESVGELECFTFSDFIADEDSQLLVDFSAGGQPLAGRLVGGNGTKVEAGGAQFEMVAGYRSTTTDQFSVALSIQNGPNDINLNLYTAEYIGPDGVQQSATTATGPIQLRPNTVSTALISFQAAAPGGRLFLGGSSADFTQTYEAEIPVG